MKAKKRVIKKQSDTRKITVSLPEETYFNIKQFAKQDIRTVSQQARLFIELGLQVMLQQDCEESQEPPEKESAIGFHVERCDDDE
jgi:hypothetical protein